MGDRYWQYRDTLVNSELFVLRSLQFKSVVYHPHKVNVVHFSRYRSSSGFISIFVKSPDAGDE